MQHTKHGGSISVNDILQPTKSIIGPSPQKVLRKRRRYRKRRERPDVKSLKKRMPYTAKSIARSFKAARVECGLTIGQLAKRIDVAIATVSRIENGHVADPRMSTLVAFADALDVPLDKLIGRSEE